MKETDHDTHRLLARRADSLDPRAIPAVHLTRLDQHYLPALVLAEVVLRSGGIRDRAGGRDAGAFLIDMNTLFERWVTAKVRRHLADRYVVHGQYGAHLDVSRRVAMRPDIVVERRGRPVLVADVKYKVSGDGLARTADYYHLLAYCTALGLDEGVLIYATADGTEPSTITVAGSGVRLRVVRWPLDAIGDTAPLVDELGLGPRPVRLAV